MKSLNFLGWGAAIIVALSLAGPAAAWDKPRHHPRPVDPVVSTNIFNTKAQAQAWAKAHADASAKVIGSGNSWVVVDNTNQNYAEGGQGGAGGQGVGIGGQGGNSDQRQQQTARTGNQSINIEAPDLSEGVPNLGYIDAEGGGCPTAAAQAVAAGGGLAFEIPWDPTCKDLLNTLRAMAVGQNLENCFGACAVYVAQISPEACYALAAMGRVACEPRAHRRSQTVVIAQAPRQGMTSALFASLSRKQQRAFCGGNVITVGGQVYALANGGSCGRL